MYKAKWQYAHAHTCNAICFFAETIYLHNVCLNVIRFLISKVLRIRKFDIDKTSLNDTQKHPRIYVNAVTNRCSVLYFVLV